MSESNSPKCPVCEAAALIPLSALYDTSAPVSTQKTFAHWICPQCGFYIGTGGTAGYNVPKDVTLTMLPDIAQGFKRCRQAYEKAVREGWFAYLSKKDHEKKPEGEGTH